VLLLIKQSQLTFTLSSFEAPHVNFESFQDQLIHLINIYLYISARIFKCLIKFNEHNLQIVHCLNFIHLILICNYGIYQFIVLHHFVYPKYFPFILSILLFRFHRVQHLFYFIRITHNLLFC